MPLPVYLAMTAAEFSGAEPLPDHLAWMACHFSPYGTGLSNLPQTLPPGSLLILNDRTPVHGHDPETVAQTLDTLVRRFSCAGVLLDLQRSPTPQARRIVQAVEALECPVGVSDRYDTGRRAVFLPPPSPAIPLRQYLAPWQGREIWLEAALTDQTLLLTKDGPRPAPPGAPSPTGWEDRGLCCHYRIALDRDSAVFHLWRTEADLQNLLDQSERLGVTMAVGLYQELS